MTPIDQPQARPFGMSATDVEAVTRYGVRLNAVDDLKAQAQAAGVTPDDAQALSNYLFSLSDKDFARESSIVRDALTSDNPARAAGTYLDLLQARQGAPDRITPDIARDLVNGVGRSATRGPGGQKGVIGRHQAGQAAQALSGMSDSDYQAIAGALKNIGKGGGPNSSDETESALILKATAARRDAFADPKSGARDEVLQFADAIRGQPRNVNVTKTNLMGLDDPNRTLQQHWANSCGPTTGEMLKGDADPVYALQMNTLDTPHSTRAGLFTVEQGIELMKNGRTPGVAAGISESPVLNSMDEPVTHQTYKTVSTGDTPEGRAGDINRMASMLNQGIDVPIRIEWNDGGGHFQLLSDVKGAAPNRQFLLNDPAAGVSAWVGEDDLATSPNGVVKGKLTHYYPGTDEPFRAAQSGR
jgi:hypothetical protein